MNEEPERKEGDNEKKGVGYYIGRVVDGFEVTALSVGVAGLTVLLIANVIARTFFQSIYFAEEVAEFLIIFVTFVGVSYAARKARHIRMGAFLDLMNPKVEKAFMFVISAISAVVMLLMAYHSFEYLLRVRAFGQTSSALRLPSWIFLVIAPIGFLSAGIQYIRTFIKNVVEKDVWQSPEQQSEYEDELYY